METLPRNKVAVVGSNPISRHLAPWDNDDYDIWVFNEAAQYDWARRVTGVFQLHKPLRYRRTMNTAHSEHWAWLQQPHDFPIWMQAVDPLVPASVEYPLQDILDRLHCERYFTSTMSYAVALAVYKGYRQIELYGIEVASATEYQYQRDGVAYWVGFAQGWGAKVVRHCAHSVFNRSLYGYEGGVYHYPDDFIRRIEFLRGEELKAIELKAKCDQALEAAYTDVNNLPDAISKSLDTSIELGRVRGKLFEQSRYLQMVQEMYDRDGMAKLDRAYFDISAGEGAAASRDAAYEVHRTAGRMDYVFMAWHQTHNPAAISQIRQFTQEHLQAGYTSGYQEGRNRENMALIQQYDERLRASGEYSDPSGVPVGDNEEQVLQPLS